MTAQSSILLVDDDQHLAQSMAQWLREEGFDVLVKFDVEGATSAINENCFDLIITDLRLGSEDGSVVVATASRQCPQTAVLVMTGYATPETAVQAVRMGAFDVLTKPIIDDELLLTIDRALNQNKIEQENETLRRELDRRSGLENILSHDYRMQKIFDVVDQVADAKASILITGENGTGKSMIARAIHHRSLRRGNPFVEVACGALPDTLLESELFGHVAGAYTGANTDRVGKFELANKGTLFLDEIGTASPAMQVKLLRVLQELQFEPLGGTETKSVDTRVILATNEDLHSAVAAGTFRQDLYYRINVVNIALPALRERRGDIPLLVDHFIHEAADTAGRQIETFDAEAMQALQNYAWPGNIRQLENVVERAVLLASGPQLTIQDLPPEIHEGGAPSAIPPFARSTSELESAPLPTNRLAGQSLREALEGPEREIILYALRRHAWNRAATADELEINRTTLYKKMKRLGLDDPKIQYSIR